MFVRQKVRNKNSMIFWVVLSLVFFLPAAWRNSFVTTFGQLLGYLTILYVFISGVRNKAIYIRKDIASLFGIVFFWIVISLVNSIRLYYEFGTLGGETTFTAPLGSIYFHLFYTALFFGYISLVEKSEKVESTVKKGINVIIWLQILVGIIQLMIVFGFPGISGIYDGINFIGILPSANFIRGMSRITLTGTEPATMGTSLGMLSFPYLLANIQVADSAKERLSCWIKLIVLLVISYFSKSTTLYVIVAFSAISFVLWLSRAGRLSKKKTVVAILIIIIGVFILFSISLTGTISLGGNILDEIKYYLIVKPSDTANMSTMHRLSPTVNDIAIIRQHPLLGVGDGNQGFTYGQNVPSYMMINPKSQDYAKGIGGVVNGGAWFWAVLSGYGVIGFFALIIWYFKYYRMKVKDLRQNNVFLYRFYIFALPAIILSLLAGAMNSTIIFILSIPFWGINSKDDAS